MARCGMGRSATRTECGDLHAEGSAQERVDAILNLGAECIVTI